MNEIELFPHNEEAYQAIIKSLENSNFSFIERATGTGKSYILIKFLASKMQGKRVLFVTTHEPMFNQLVNQDMNALGTSKDIYDKLDLVIYPNINKKSAEWYFENYDCFIFDEAHHCGAPIWGETISEIRDLVKKSDDKIMIGATATSIRYLDNYTDVAEVYFDNNVASRLNLSNAILNEILPAPIYINLCGHLEEDIDRIKRKLASLGNLVELDSIRKMIDELDELYTKENNVNELLKSNGVKNGEKYIIFCSNKEDLKRKMKEAQYWFNNIGNIETYQVHSSNSKKNNQKQIDDFAKQNPNSIKLMFAIDIFNEGMHVPGVDGIIMTRRTASPIVYLQQLGRALSFSARKKQIKIFDIVGNASNIDVIYNLYKELLYVAEEESILNPEKKEHYQEVVERFKIVKKSNELIETINKLEEFLDNNYIKKNKIERYISYLEQYVEILNDNFMHLLENNKIDYEHKKIYDSLCQLVNNLNINDIYRLNKIGVIISPWQNDNNILEKISKSGSYKKTIENDIIEIFNMYNNFYLKNQRRPSINIVEEQELANKYRNYLTNLRPVQFKKILRDVSYQLTVEEQLILNGFPKIKEIDAYLDQIEYKYYNGIIIDELENKTLKKISLIMNLNNRPIIKNLVTNKTFKIDQAIETLKNKITIHYSDKDFIPLELIKLDNDAYNAYKYIKKNYKHISNTQFQIILDLKIELTDELNMTMEERLKLLNGNNNIFELEHLQKKKTTKNICDFINKMGRRPDPNNENEASLAKKYYKILRNSNSIYLEEISNSLVNNNISLTFDEKIIMGFKISSKELDELYYEIIEDIKECKKEKFIYEIVNKKVEYLKNNERIDYKLYKILIRTINLMRTVFETKELNKVTKNALETKVWNYKDVIPPNLIPYLTQLGIILPKRINDIIINLNQENINIAYKQYKKDTKLYYEYIDYIKKNKCRPPEESKLSIYIRKYLIDSNINDRRIFIKTLNKLEISILEEELFISDNLSEKSQLQLYEKISSKINQGKTLNLLEQFVYENIKLKVIIKDNVFIEKKLDTYKNKVSKELSISFIENIKTHIEEYPDEEIDFAGDLALLPYEEKRKLKEFQKECIANKFLNRVIEEMKTFNKSLEEIFEKKDYILYHEIEKDKKYIKKIDEIKEINKDIVLKRNCIIINDFIEEYSNFLKQYGREPKLYSSDMLEKIIAEKYQLVFALLNSNERKKIILLTEKILDENNKKDLYKKFIEFVNLNKRMPSILSDNDDEVNLATLYQNEGSKLTKDQKKEISILQKKYQANTIKYFVNKKGR